MAIPVQFLTRFAVPLIVAALTLPNNRDQQATLYAETLRESDRVLSIANREGEGPTETYDYIIIGAGAAGAVVANRLTASGSGTVLLLDGGGDPNPVVEVPVLQGATRAAGMMKGYVSVEQTGGCLGNAGARCGCPRGIALGGSTAVNGLFYHRGHRKDYDLWANFTGDAIWSFDNVVDALRAVETYGGAYAANPGPNHGTSGEMHISAPEYTPGVDIVEQALRERTIPLVDINSLEHDWGFSRPDYNIKNGLRDGTYEAFLEPILSRTNLKIYRYAWVTRIVLDGNNRATGVIYKRHGETRFAAAAREVIVAAGVFDTPKLLMMSGIGPREHLESHGIETVVHLPSVGNYMQDHVGSAIPHLVLNRVFGRVNLITPDTIKEFIENGTGPLNRIPSFTIDNGIHVNFGHFSSRTWNDSTHPDIHVYIDTGVYSEPGEPLEQAIWADIQLGLPHQSGTVQLSSSDPEADPLIDPKFLVDHPNDLERFVDAMEYMVDFFLNTDTFKELGIRWRAQDPRIEGCKHLPFPSREYWRCHIPLTSGSTLHPTSSCRMARNANEGCVDSRLRVFNTTALRIIDSSVIPFVPMGNSMMPTVLVGEVGARILLGEV